MSNQRRYRVGIDVGLNSVGLAAIEIGAQGEPIRLLSCLTVIHDAGVDPGKKKTGETRRAESGLARRTRRLVRRRRKRLLALDRTLEGLGYPLPNLEDFSDSYLPWRVRAELTSVFTADEADRREKIAVAVRHMARHRGWRNPWMRVESLLGTNAPSEFLDGFRTRAEKLTSTPLSVDSTPGEITARVALTPAVKLRGAESLLGGKLHQSDNARELEKIIAVQQIPAEDGRKLIEAVFKAESPRGASAKLVGKDPLPGQGGHLRASKASLAFQNYRIVAQLGNLRIREHSTERPLSAEERQLVFQILANPGKTGAMSWHDVAEKLEIERNQLRGTATPFADGDRAAARPVMNVTEEKMQSCKSKAVKQWWKNADELEKESLLEAIALGGTSSEDTPAAAEVAALLETLSEDDMTKLYGMELPTGRAAYSTDSLRRLTARMLEHNEDLHAARIAEFGVAPDWQPPADPINEPVGNPSVDRVLKVVGRWLMSAESRWGAPLAINVEHVRAGFMSEATAHQLDREMSKRYKTNLKELDEARQQLNLSEEFKRSNLMKYQAVKRQNCQCLYCGEPITYQTAEMDHIVPRAGRGSTNRRENLAAVCIECNRSKTNISFAKWAVTAAGRGVSPQEAIQRVRAWIQDEGMPTRVFRDLQKGFIARLKQTEADPEFDDRSLESVAWMANELRHRIQQHFRYSDTRVDVFRGSLTADARRASGIENRIELIGGKGKDRLDRRHHAVDAAVIAMMRRSVGTVLAERNNIRQSERITGTVPETWKNYRGKDAAHQLNYDQWLHNMGNLLDLLNTALVQDRIPVMQNLRLRLNNSASHDDTIRKLRKVPVGAEMSAAMIDRASTPALWCALTRHPDYDPKAGLPEDWNRKIRVNGTHFKGHDEIGFFGTGAAAIAVRGGYAEIGDTIHHARVYRIDGGKKPVFAMLRVFATDLQHYRHEDLFGTELPPQSISVRTADPRLKSALESGAATYLGWLVAGDEIILDPSKFTSGQIGGFMEKFPGTNRWQIDGFKTPSKLRLRPRMLASEGVTDAHGDSVKKIVDRPGWLPEINVILNSGPVTIVRRDTLGIPRISDSGHGLPISWHN